MSILKRVAAVLLVIVIASIFHVQHQMQVELGQENAGLQSQVRQLEEARRSQHLESAQPTETSATAPVDNPELHELLRLLGEVTVLRNKLKELNSSPSVPPGEPQRQIVAHASFDPDGKRLMTLDQDGTVRQWSITNSQESFR